MPDNLQHLKEILSSDVQAPFMFGMVTKVKTFVIDNPMIALISLLVIGSSSTGVFIYQLSEARGAITVLMAHNTQLIKDNTKLIAEVSYLRRDVDKLTIIMERHLDGHPVRIVR
jgi:hypothetical protein